jgi:polyisoprenoid-binding protein YceI
MKRLLFATGLLALAAPLVLAQTSAPVSTPISTWTSDAAHSEVDFSIRHLGISNVRGRFGNVAATLTWNQDEISRSTVTATIGAATVDTGVQMRDADLKSANFFDVANFPTATFTSTRVVKNGHGLKVNGNLTLHGVTQPVVLEVEGPSGPVPGLTDHKPHCGFSATTTISRTAFGIGGKYPAAIVGDEVKLTIDLDVVKQ